jgi:transcription-repair coupling factor (superfamily II helicase)
MKFNNNFNLLIDSLKKEKQFRRVLDSAEKPKTIINNVKGSLRSLLAAELFTEINGSIFIICENSSEALNYLNDLEILIGKKNLAALFKMPKHVKNRYQKSDDSKAWMLEGINLLINQNSFIAIATKEIFEAEIPAPDELYDNTIELKINQVLNFTEFTKGLFSSGFERKDYVSEPGEAAVRGGIIDIFPVSWDNPIRIEFWGDEIESIREFDPISQRSINDHDSVEFLSKFMREEQSSGTIKLNELIDKNALLYIDTPDAIFADGDFTEELNNNRFLINSINKSTIKFKSSEQQSFDSSILKFAEFLKNNINITKKIFICGESKNHIERLQNIIFSNLENSLEMSEAQIEELFSKISWHSVTFANGFSLPPDYFIFTEHEVFERNRIPDRGVSKSKAAISLKELNSLRIGDYVVHEDKGVGRFEGFRTIQIGGSAQDCVQLAFEGNDIMYVNMQYVNKIQKYSAQEGTMPKLSKLGSTEWQRKKSRTKKKLKDIARDLIKIYAKRKMEAGFAFQTDTTWQKEFEASFIYDDTIDQANATEEIKADMESDTPMDRLLCGDVGFGKTEVAIRAAFKAVQAGKQVAVLVPTTVLAQQHYMTFKDRLARYPLNVEVMSRFRTKKEQTGVLEGLKAGKVDILIGTHRILSKDIEFKDLGLLIVDEEQRFGVSAKEKLRQMRVSIDTLTLTATPIPRTLNFSLMGARDLSVIETPPRNRLPVYTEILEWDDEFIQEAIEKEVNRGGQVFFVSDRVQDLDKIAMDLKMLMPAYDFATAHGQMKPSELEKIMQKFISGKVDVLVTTKIVESGLDIPNANTMIINRANNFGLAELYQLRGRVGRTNQQAYCYLLLPKGGKISRVAVKRLQAIEEFTDLGSGFQLAMKDMEIRGAGNLLGAEQSGMIFDIGYEMYQKVLDEAVGELKKDEFADIFDDPEKLKSKFFENEEIAIEINEDALIPEDFITTDTERFSYYKTLYSLKKQRELNELKVEIKDKYGKFPKEFDNLLFAVKLRINAVPTGFSKVVLKPNKMICEFPPQSKEDYYAEAFPLIMDYVQSMPETKLVQGKKALMWEVPIESREKAVELMWKIAKSLEALDYE